ncbi:MAG: hypothetical protein JWR61_5802 [Ferruginibacter sp.]|nr:hypothetical protein [Ferruginibacter sp.]
MRDKARILPVLMRIAHAWMQHPDLRLGQIITNLSGQNIEISPGAKTHAGKDMFSIEDEDLAEVFENYLNSFE